MYHERGCILPVGPIDRLKERTRLIQRYVAIILSTWITLARAVSDPFLGDIIIWEIRVEYIIVVAMHVPMESTPQQ